MTCVEVKAERVTLYKYFSRIQYLDGAYEYVLRDDEIEFRDNPVDMTVTAIFNRNSLGG